MLDLQSLQRFNADFVSLVMNEVKARNYRDVSEDSVNLFREMLFTLFRNVRQMVIAADGYGADGYPFSLQRMLLYAVPRSLRRVTVQGRWLQDAFTDSVQQMCRDQGWQAVLGGRQLELYR